MRIAADDLEVSTQTEVRENNIVTLRKLLLIVPVMIAFCFAMVPLYRQICEVLGVTATRAIAQNSQIDMSRSIKLDFDATNRNLAWRFEPIDRHIEVHPGAIVTINYRVINMTDRAMTGRAIPSFGPAEGGLYFNKIECFCFSNQTLQAGETRDMPVTFYVDPKMPKAIEAIALSYTLFDVTDSVKKS